MEQLQNLQKLIMESFRPQCMKLRQLLPDEAETLKTAQDAQFKEIIPAVETLLVTLRAKKPAATDGRQAAPVVAGPTPTQPDTSRVVDTRKGIQMTRLEAPKFDGKARNYLRFKHRFEELVTAQFDSMAQLEYLEKGLPQKVQDKLTLVQKTPEQVWEQLDTLYADPEVVLKESVAELHALDSKKLGQEFMVRFATTLEDTEALLERDGNADYL